MARTVTTDMNVSLHTEGAFFARLWTITRRDGVVLRITDHDEPIIISTVTYRSDIGFTPCAAVSSSINFGSQSTQFQLAMTDDGMREDDVRSRKWHNAQAVMSIVDWTNPTSKLDLWSGRFGRITITEKNRATIDLTAFAGGSSAIGGAVYSMTCRNSLGDASCGVNIQSLRANFTVMLVTDEDTFVADNLLGRPDGFYSLGQLVWDTGQNVGQVSEVQTSLLTNEVGLFYPTLFPVVIGDTGHVFPGCDLLVTTCRDKFHNVATGFNGEPFNIQPRIISLPASSGSPGVVHRHFLAAAG